MKKFKIDDQENKSTKIKDEEPVLIRKGATAAGNDTITPPPENSAAEENADQAQLAKSKMNGDAIRGAGAIEAYLKKSFIALLSFKQSYNFPLHRENGQPVVYLKDLTAWLKTLGVADFSHLTTDFLRDFFDTKRRLEKIENTSDKPLNSVNEIIGLTGRDAATILGWRRDFPDDCPIEKRGGVIVCRSARELLKFMHVHRIPTNLSGLNYEDTLR